MSIKWIIWDYCNVCKDYREYSECYVHWSVIYPVMREYLGRTEKKLWEWAYLWEEEPMFRRFEECIIVLLEHIMMRIRMEWS